MAQKGRHRRGICRKRRIKGKLSWPQRKRDIKAYIKGLRGQSMIKGNAGYQVFLDARKEQLRQEARERGAKSKPSYSSY